MPFLLLLYILAFLDRVNVGYAKQAFLRDTGLSEATYAFGAGIFFLGYALFEVPSNLAMHRVGARVWMCRIMVTWGLISAAMAFAWSEASFHGLRFLLGVAEAGFFPGVILYLTYWFPASRRGTVMGLFYLGAPLAQIFGGPVSGLLLELDGFGGLHGWQWMFLVEGLAASAVGVWTFWYLPDRPADAAWLDAAQRSALASAVAAEEPAHGDGHPGVWAMLCRPRVLYFGLIYGLIQISVYGVIFYLPAQVSRLLGREAGLAVGLVSAIPWTCALAAAFALPRLAGRIGRRRAVVVAALLAAGAGIAGSASGSPGWALAALCVATAGFIGAQPLFWTFPTGELTGVQAAGGIALINSLGALGGFIAPNLRVFVERSAGASTAGLYALAGASLLAAVLVAVLREARPRPEQA
ncbi:MAG: MFS transporter [Opitutaceae bacterium]|nr:MFS transporter [Opitutaceae bacterium]